MPLAHENLLRLIQEYGHACEDVGWHTRAYSRLSARLKEIEAEKQQLWEQTQQALTPGA